MKNLGTIIWAGFIIVALLVILAIFVTTPHAEAKVTSKNVIHLLPAPKSTVAWAKAWEGVARREYKKWSYLRQCLGMKPVAFLADLPPRRANKAEWTEVGRTCKHAVPVYHDKAKELLYRITHPTGGIERWLPLAYYVGWPRSQARALVLCWTLESGGRPSANENPPYCGLMQIYHGSLNPMANLRQGLSQWLERGWQPWPPVTARGY